MRTLNLKCDRCGASETVDHLKDSKLDLWRVGIACQDPSKPNGGYSFSSTVPVADLKASQEWCITCRTQVGLVFKTQEELKAVPNPTLEEQLIECLRNFVQQEQQQQQ